MLDNHSVDWNKESLRSLRLRMGWSKSDLARRLDVSCQEVDSWEEGQSIQAKHKGILEVLLHQAEACSEETRMATAAESKLEKTALEQIDFTLVKADLE